MQRPIICLLIILIVGIVVGSYFSFPYYPVLIAASLMLLLVLIGLRYKWFVFCFICIAGFTFLLGVFNIQKHNFFLKDNQNILNFTDRGKMTLEGIVTESPLSYTDKNVLIVKCIRIMQDSQYTRTSGNIRLTIPADLNFQYGDFIRFQTSLKKIRNFNNPGRFNYERFMALQGIYVSGFINETSEIFLLRKNTASRIRLKLEEFKCHLKTILRKNSFSPEKEIIEAMTLGNQNEIPADIRDNFSKTGTSHILSISGLHIGMVGTTFFLMIFLVLKSSEYLMLRFNIIKLAAALAFIIVLFYAFIAGMGIPVMRATLMALIFLLALLLGKQHDLYNTLALAGIIILIIFPEALFDISFQLSFMSVWAIIFIVPRFHHRLPLNIPNFPPWIISIIRYLYLSVMVCIAATIGTLPLIIYYFDRVSIITVIANTIIVPLLGTLTLSVAMFFILFSFSVTLSGYFVQLASFLTQISVNMINKLASLPFSSISVLKPDIPEIILFYCMMFMIVQLIDQKTNVPHKLSARKLTAIKYLFFIVLLFTAADITYLMLKDKLSSELKITMIDVGQGNATLLEFPHGGKMIIDGGGFHKSSFDVGKGVVAPFLCKKRIGRIDTAVLTHPHPDHLLGLIYIMNNFNTKHVWKTILPVDANVFPEWERAIKMNQINVSFLSNQSPEKIINGVKFKILWPSEDYLKNISGLSYDSENDSSLVLKITYGKISFLLPGDISSDIERKLVESKSDLKSDVLLFPHHGSHKSSCTEFIKFVSCRYAVVSSGKSNVFKHPHPEVLKKYQKTGSRIFRTDQHGATTFTTDGNNLRVNTFIRNN